MTAPVDHRRRRRAEPTDAPAKTAMGTALFAGASAGVVG